VGQFLSGISTLDSTPGKQVLEQAVTYIQTHHQSRLHAPEAAAVVEALLAAEKAAKRHKTTQAYAQFLGTWRLGFVTGTQKSRQRAGIVLGAGRFLPKLAKFQLIYQAEPDASATVESADTAATDSGHRGRVTNRVKLGALKLQLNGPARLWPRANCLAFDFTQMQVKVGGFTLYQGYIRSGADREQSFYSQPLKTQAFFSHFIITETYIAARGRGGGLALWVREH
jgi:hypothetical protein